MKILLTANIYHHPASGGVTKVNRKLLEGLAARGHDVKTVVPALGVPSRITHDELLADLRARGVSIVSSDGVDVFQLNGVEVHAVVERRQLRQALVAELEAWRPDRVIVSSEDPSQNLLNAALKTCPGRVVYMANTTSMLPFGPHAFFASKTRTAMFEQVTGILTVTDYVGRYIKQYAGLSSTTMYVPLYDTGPFPEISHGDAPYVVMINPSCVKGASIFIELARRMPEVAFAAVPSWATTPEDLNELASIANVTVLPHEIEINQVYAQTRVLLYPSLWAEALSLATIEAMYQGIPVLASNIGGIPEAKMGTDYLLPVREADGFEKRTDANHVPVPRIGPQDVGPWQHALGELLGDRALYERQSAAARAAARRYAERATVDAYEHYLSNLQVPS